MTFVQQEEMVATAERTPVAAVPGASRAVNAYRREQVLNLSPVEVILKLYDTAIVSCKRNEHDLTRRVLNELIAALNFEHKEISLGLYRLYDYCKRCLRENRPQETVMILEELRGVWAQAFNL
jgi:flagellin-specific chaperone FliS